MNVLRRFAIFVVAVVIGFITPVSTYALTDAQLEFYAQNNIMFYDPDGGEACSAAEISGNSVTVIGDSISVGASAYYRSLIPNADIESKTFDGVTYDLIKYSKHFYVDTESNHSGETIADVLQQQGELRPYVVFALGTNDAGRITDSVIDDLMRLIGTNHRVVFVTNYATENQLDFSTNNAAIRAAKDRYDNVAVADWAAEMESKSDPSEYIPDTTYYVHPNAKGSELFVKLIKQALDSLASGGVGTNYNRNYAGVEVWSEADLQTIEANRPIYEEAARAYNFPWQVLAILHKHETGLRRWNPKNGQGVYQLYGYTRKPNSKELDPNKAFLPEGDVNEDEFRRQTMIAAGVVSGMVGDLNDPNNVKELFFRYNGRASVYIDRAVAMGFSREDALHGEGSPYVMNRYDEARDPTSANMSPYWRGRFTGDGHYDPDAVSYGFGAFVQYEALVGGSSAYCSNSSNGKIADTAIELAWSVEEWATKDYTSSKRCLNGGMQYPQCIPKDTYEEALNKTGGYAGTGYSDYFERWITVSRGASCDQFVYTVMKYSEADSSFRQWGASSQKEYMEGHPEKYSKIEAHRIEDLQPGDIFVSSGHIVLYVGQVNGKETVAEASFGMYTGRLDSDSSYLKNLRNNGEVSGYTVFRRINWEG